MACRWGWSGARMQGQLQAVTQMPRAGRRWEVRSWANTASRGWWLAPVAAPGVRASASPPWLRGLVGQSEWTVVVGEPGGVGGTQRVRQLEEIANRRRHRQALAARLIDFVTVS